MNGIVKLTNFAGSIGGVASALGNLASDFGVGSGWQDSLRQASFGGVPFGVDIAAGQNGRKVAVHQYPWRDGAWPEDMGQKERRYEITGFLIENSVVYGGGSVIQQLGQLRAVCEMAGPQSVVHPLFGAGQASALDFNWEARADLGRVIQFRLSLLKGLTRIFPVTQSSGVASAVSGLQSASLLDMVKDVASIVAAGAAAVSAAVTTVVGFLTSVYKLVHDVRRVFNSISNLSGNFGLLFGGGNKGYAGSNIDTNSTATTSGSLEAGVAHVAAVMAASSSLQAAAGNIGSDQDSFASAALSLMASIASAATSPRDAIQILSTLAAYSSIGATTSSVIGNDMATMQTAVSAFMRRAAIAQLASVATTFQPQSVEDALAVRNAVIAVIDDEITHAGDAGDDNSYMALKALRQAVVADLNDRATQLSSMADYTFQAALPALSLAQQLYQDAARADELILEAGAVHPAFMPTNFTALAQ